MDVSVNYPWGTHCERDPVKGGITYMQSPGWDLGLAPSGWGLPDPRSQSSVRYGGRRPARVPPWRIHLADDIRAFHHMGLKAVRFALLFNGLTYGVDREIPQEQPDGRYSFEPVPLSGEFLEDFRILVQTFADYANANGKPHVRLMPVLVGFEFLSDPYVGHETTARDPKDRWSHYVSGPLVSNLNHHSDFIDECGVRYRAGRRADALSTAPSRAVPSLQAATAAPQTKQQRFLSLVLDRLLGEFEPGAPLARCRDAIHSWDLCGEPEGCVPMLAQRSRQVMMVSAHDMGSYLAYGVSRVMGRGFAATVGFRFLGASQRFGWTLPRHLGQFHTYDSEQLPLVSGDADALIGEAATTASSLFDPRVMLATGARVPLSLRLEWFERLRYREVFLWSAGRAAPDERHSWTPVEAEQIYNFAVLGLRPHRDVVNRAFARAYPQGVP